MIFSVSTLIFYDVFVAAAKSGCCSWNEPNLIKLAKKYRISFVRTNLLPTFVGRFRQTMELKITDLGHIRETAREFVNHIGNHRVFAFYGTMGAGKTTFIKAICEELGVEEVITSPTFAIVNEYSISHPLDLLPTLRSVYHFDFYRIKKLEEVYDMGYEDYFYSGALCFIEWPELIDDLLPEDAVHVMIREENDGSRSVVCQFDKT